MQRQIVLDTETTGLEPELGHRVIEIGCIEMVNRRVTGKSFHKYLNPDRDIDLAATEVHGKTRADLENEPRFAEIAEEFVEFVTGAELVIHNAPFDVGFINSELKLANFAVKRIEDCCEVLDTLVLARNMHPGQRNSLDALCKRYEIDNSQRQLHGALLDANILADVYLAMTGGQATFALGGHANDSPGTSGGRDAVSRINRENLQLAVLQAGADELVAHEQRLDRMEKDGVASVWRNSREKP